MRTAFIETIEKLAARDRRIFLLNGDLGFSVLEPMNKRFPERSLNMGVAEANMISVAAGLAMSGKIVFVYSIVPFVTARVFEQVRNDIGLHNANVKIVGVGSGLTYGQLGPTHHSIEDIALMRTIPGMTVFAPGDPMETRLVTEAAAKIKGPVYIRIGKKGEPAVHAKKPQFQVGKGILVRRGKHLAILAVGNMLKTAVDAAAILEQKKKGVEVISFPTVKPLDVPLVKNISKKFQAIFTLEEHSIIGGFGSAVAEVIAEEKIRPKIFARFGIRDRITFRSGSQEYLRRLHGLAPEQIAKTIEIMLKKM